MAPRNKKEEIAPKPEATPPKVINPSPAQTPGPEKTASSLAPVGAPGHLMSSAPDWLKSEMKGRQAQGLEKADNTDIIIPRLVLAQSNHPQVKAGLVKEGDIFNNLTNEVLCEVSPDPKKPNKLRIIPVVLGKSRILFEDMDKGGGILCRADDALKARPGGKGEDAGGQPTDDCLKCVLKEWDDSAEGKEAKPGCTHFHNTVVMLPEFGYALFVWSCKSTQAKVAKRFLSTAKQTGADFYAQGYSIWTVPAKSGKFDFYNYDFSVLGWVSEPEYKHGKSVYDNFQGKVVAMDTSDLEKPPGDDPEQEGGDETFPPDEVSPNDPPPSGGPRSPEPPPPSGGPPPDDF